MLRQVPEHPFQLPTVLDTGLLAGHYIPAVSRVTGTAKAVQDESANACTQIPTAQNGTGGRREQKRSSVCDRT